MSAAHSLYRRHGRLRLPLQRTRENNLSGLDPAHQILLDLFEAALLCELEPVWADATRATALDGAPPVRLKLPALPEVEVLQQFKADWPLLTVGPSQSAARSEAFGFDQDKLTQRWDVDYILCPLALGNEIRLRPVLRAVTKILRLVVLQGGHRAYLTRTNGSYEYAANVLTGEGDDCCGFYACGVVESAAGTASFVKDGPRYLAASVTLESVEVSDYVGDGDADAVPLLGTTGTLGVTESGDPPIIVRD